MKTLQEKKIELQFKGERDYLHGTDMYNAATECLASFDSSVIREPLRMTIHDIIRRQCRFVFTENGDQIQKPENAKVEILFSNYIGWYVETNESVEGRYSYDEDSIANKAVIKDKSAAIDQDLSYSAIEIIVAMNKKLLSTLLAPNEGKWYFTRIDLNRFLPQEAKQYTLTLVQNIHNRLTKSTIELDGEKIGHIYFSLVK